MISAAQYAWRVACLIVCIVGFMVIVHVLTGCGPLPLDTPPPEAVAPDVQYSALWGGAFMLGSLVVVALFCRDAWRNVLGRGR